MSSKKIGIKLKKIREDWGQTQEFVAKRIKLSQPQLSKIEAGEQDISAETLKIFAKKFHVSPLLLFGIAAYSDWQSMMIEMKMLDSEKFEKCIEILHKVSTAMADTDD